MFYCILVATDPTSAARVVPIEAAELHAFGAQHVTLLYVPSVVQPGDHALSSDLERHADRLRADGLSVDVEVVGGYPAGELVNVADRLGADLIVIGARARRSSGRAIVGSTSSEVLRRAHVPVLLNPPPRAHQPGGPRLAHVLLATDASRCARGAERLAIDLSSTAHRMTLMTVLGDAGAPDQDLARDHLETLRQQMRTDATIRVVEDTRASDAIVRASRETRASLVVVGRRGRSARPRQLVGSTAENLTRKVATPVIVVPGP